MKKSLIALAALAATSAFAQVPTAQPVGSSSVTVFGVLDATVTRLTASNSGSVTILDGGGRNASSRLGFRGTEDLGGGLAAAFWLEAGVNVDNGSGANTTLNNTAAGDKITMGQTSTPWAPTATAGARQGLTFNRASTVSLISKDLGEVRLGRDYSPTFWNYTVYDPFGTVGAGSVLNVIGGPLAPVGIQAFPPGAAYPMVRTSNSIGWLSPNWNGVTAQLQYALSEQPTNCAAPLTAYQGNTCWGANGDGKMVGGRLAYAAGPLSAALAYSKTDYGNVATAAAPTGAIFSNTTAYRGNYTQMNLGGAYDLGVARLMAQYGTQTQAASGVANEKKMSSYMLAAVVPVGALSIKASYAEGKRDDATGAVAGANEIGSKNTQFALGAQYDFSKRTAVYGTYSSNKLTAGATTAGALRVNLGLAGAALATGTSATATGIDIGIRHSF